MFPTAFSFPYNLLFPTIRPLILHRSVQEDRDDFFDISRMLHTTTRNVRAGGYNHTGEAASTVEEKRFSALQSDVTRGGTNLSLWHLARLTLSLTGARRWLGSHEFGIIFSSVNNDGGGCGCSSGGSDRGSDGRGTDGCSGGGRGYGVSIDRVLSVRCVIDARGRVYR